MKGGYQILDLTGATAGSPVEVKGIYKAAAGNNGKPVLILTNDGQRVYAEIAEDAGDFITCYISAEGKTVNITIKSDDSVTTVISDPGASITGLEQAVNELNDNKAAKSDISTLQCTGSVNTTGETIVTGRYFYLNGALCKATADIANGATFTRNTNFAVVTIDEELSALNSKTEWKLIDSKIGTGNINLPAEFGEILVLVDPVSTTGYQSNIEFLIPKIALNDTDTIRYTNLWNDDNSIVIIVSLSNVYIISAKYNGTDNKDTAKITAYYR